MSTAALASQVAAQTGCTIRGAQPQRIIVAPNQASPAEGQEIIARLAEAMGVQSVEKMVYGDAQIWTLSPDQDADRMAKLLNMYSFVRYAEVDSYRSPQSAPNKDRDCDVE